MDGVIIACGIILVGLGVTLASASNPIGGIPAAVGVFLVAIGVLGQALRDARKYLK
jgi:hypothetical protein